MGRSCLDTPSDLLARIVSAWLPRWPILRFLTGQARGACSGELIDDGQPFVLTMAASGEPRIAALNAAAEAQGLAPGDRMADARAMAGPLQARAANPAADAAALRRLALWATRYTPAVAPWGELEGADGFFLDISGASHLFGGEKRLLADLSQRLDRLGLPSRLAVAGTVGVAWALSHFHPESCCVLPPGQEREALEAMPVEALRFPPDMCATLRRLGFKRAGALIGKPRAPLASRFPLNLLLRLDQALGRVPEPLALLAPPPAYRIMRQLLEPIVTQEAVVRVAEQLMEELAASLERDGAGARTLRLTLYRIDGEVRSIEIGLTAPMRCPAHVAHLIDLRLERIVDGLDAGFGFETLELAVMAHERLPPRQAALPSAGEAGSAESLAALIDSIRQRLGSSRVRRLVPVESHMPERAEVCRPTGSKVENWPAPNATHPRPVLLFRSAEPVEVTALIPDGPPRYLRWRGKRRRIVAAQGPERIATEWWRSRTKKPTRDYFVIEDEAGRRMWVYREGIYGREEAMPRWFVHGLFA
jgi:protein ImuB